MKNNIKQQAEIIIKEIKNRLHSNGLKVSHISEKNFNYEVVVAENKTLVKVLIYFGKKGIRKVIQGNVDLELYKKVGSLVYEQQSLSFNNNIDEPEEYIGSDESGKGDVFGPLVVAAFYVNPEIKYKLTTLDIRDSKDLTDQSINSIGKKLQSEFSQYWECVIISPERYNEIYRSFLNLNKLLNWAHSTAISNLLKKVKCSHIIVDKFSKEILLQKDITAFDKLNIDYTEKAERFLAVAAASIISRYKLNIWFQEQHKNGNALPKGSYERIEESLVRLSQKYGKENIHKFAKIHFKNVKKSI